MSTKVNSNITPIKKIECKQLFIAQQIQRSIKEKKFK
jgi:hypothetical protein